MILKVEATKNCNQSCLHCSFSRRYSTRTENLTLDQLQKQIQQLRTNNQLPTTFTAMVTGGEPLLNPEIFDLIRYLKSVGAEYISLATNGIPFINNDDLKKQLNSSPVNELVVSVSTSNSEYQFLRQSNQDLVMKEIIAIKNQNPRLIMTGNYLLHNGNLSAMESLIETNNFPFSVIRFLNYSSNLAPQTSPLKEVSQLSLQSLERKINQHNYSVEGNLFNVIKTKLKNLFINKPLAPIALIMTTTPDTTTTKSFLITAAA